MKRWIAIVPFLAALVLLSSVPPVVMAEKPPSPIEVIKARTENSKTYDLGDGRRQIEIHLGPIHYKDDYSSLSEQWKDIDTTIVNGKVAEAPYVFEVDTAKKAFTVTNKRTREVSTITFKSVAQGLDHLPTLPTVARVWGNRVDFGEISPGVHLSIVVENNYVRFVRTIDNPGAAQVAKFDVEGPGFVYRAFDKEGTSVPVDVTSLGTERTERFTATPDQYPITIDPTWQVGATHDDCLYRTSDGYFSDANATDAAGASSGTSWGWATGLRFTNITIPPGSNIYTAVLTFTANADRAGTACNTYISAEDVDNAGDFSGDNGTSFKNVRYAAHTTALVSWDGIGAWTTDTEYDSPEIKDVIQEMVDRGDWTSGDAIVLFWEDIARRSTPEASFPRRDAYSWDGSAAKAAVLTIVAGTTPTLVAVNATSVGSTTATIGANITDIGGNNCTSRGLEWGLAPGTYTAGNWTEVGSYGTGEYTHGLSALTPLTPYYYRGFATNPIGTSYSGECTFTTLQAQCLAPTNFVVSELGGSEVGINWTLGTYATNTLIIGKSGSYPTDREDGWVAYNSTAVSTTDTHGLSFDYEKPYFRAWSWNNAGFSVNYAEGTAGGDSMNNLTLFLVFVGIIGMGGMWLAVSRRPRNMLISTAVFLAWMFFGFWWLNDDALSIFGVTGVWINLMYYLPFVFAFAVALDLLFNIDKVVVTRGSVSGGRTDTYQDLVSRSKLNPREGGLERYRRELYRRTRK